MAKSFPVFITMFLFLAASTTLSSTNVETDWIRHYTSEYGFAFAFAIAADGSGNVYVTGSSFAPNGLPDYATIKYSSAGDRLWVRLYNGPGDSWDVARDMALDTSGNVYVTGESYGSDYFDYVTIKYSPAGVQEWVARYDGPDGDDSARALAVDESGNVYVTGQSSGSGTVYDYATIKYNPLGVQEWVARYNGPGNTRDMADDLAIDGSGNVYVTGSSGEGSPNLSDYVTIKYNPSGLQRWVARYNNAYDYATAIAADASGNVYVTGYSYGYGTYYDYATVKYDTTGRLGWAARYFGEVDDYAYALTVDSSGNVYVTGDSFGSGTSSDYATIKYSARGRQRWVARYNGPGNSIDVGNAIAIDASGNVYVTGESNGTDHVGDFATVKYGPKGVRHWVARYAGPGDSFDQATAIAVDASGSVHVTGSSAVTGGRKYTTIKYTQNSN